jgi:hypothetical protein
VRSRSSVLICGTTCGGCPAAVAWPGGSPCPARRTSGSRDEERSRAPRRQPSAVRRTRDLRTAGSRPFDPGCVGICRCRDDRGAVGARPSASPKCRRGMSRASAVARAGPCPGWHQCPSWRKLIDVDSTEAGARSAPSLPRQRQI